MVSLNLGIRYGGSSIMNAALLSLKMVFLNSSPNSAASTMPPRYRLSTTSVCPLAKNAPAMSAYTGSLAEQLMNGTSRMVLRLSCIFSMVLAAIAAGTVQPKPISKGMKLLPLKPIFRMGLSMMNAIRLI